MTPRPPLATPDDQGKRSAGFPTRTKRAWRRSRSGGAPSLAIVIAALILLASAPPTHAALLGQGSRSASGLSPRETAFRPASMGLSAGPAGAALQSSLSPNYDEQIGATFTQDLGALTYNVTALAQADMDGYGPAYLLNGLTTAGYWYQVGVSYHWPSSNGGYDPTFGFSYEVFGSNGKAVYPLNGGAGLGTFSNAVHSGDSVLLSLTFSGSTVEMLAQDWSTGATAKTSYSSEGASSFVGDTSELSNSEGFFTGTMTEWYHVLPYSANEGEVTYTNAAVALNSAWLWIDEFNSATTGPPLFDNETQAPVVFANSQQLYPFSSNGATIYGSAHQFITGMLNMTSTSPTAVSSKVTLTPATTESSSPSFTATYTLAGQPQTATIAAGATVIHADTGTSITVSSAASGSSTDVWVFNGTSGTEVSFAAGTNATYVYYHLLREVVSYRVAGGGQALPASSTFALTYEEPPPVASATPSKVTATQALAITPSIVFALLGSEASLTGSIPEPAGERWAASAENWTVSAPNVIPDPIQLYQQYDVTVGYAIVGGGTPPQTPEFRSTSFGSPSLIQLSSVAITGWFDAGSDYSFTGILNGTTSERWLSSLADNPAGGALIIASPDLALTAAYVHQYYASLSVNDASGGVISQGSGWFDAGGSLNASASANAQWQFELWNGSGVGAYSGTSPSIDVTVRSPLSENATFYVQLAISADVGTNIAFFYSTFSYVSQTGTVHTGTVQSGTAKTLYVPPSSNVTLRASPSLFVYSFSSWRGTGLANSTKPSLALVVDSPTAVTGTSAYNYEVLIGGAATAAVVILAVALLVRGKGKKQDDWSYPQM